MQSWLVFGDVEDIKRRVALVANLPGQVIVAVEQHAAEMDRLGFRSQNNIRTNGILSVQQAAADRRDGCESEQNGDNESGRNLFATVHVLLSIQIQITHRSL